MSFILDALQKDQLEQQPQPTPTGMLHPPKPAPVKRWGLWLLGAALLINAAVIGWYLLSQKSSTTDGSNGSNVAPSIPGAQRELSIAPASLPLNSVPITAAPNNAANKQPRSNSLPKRSPVRNPVAAAAPTRTTPKTRPSKTATTVPTTGSGRVLSPEQAAQMGIGDELLSTPNKTQNSPASQTTSTVSPTPRSRTTPAAKTEPANSRASNTITIAELPTAARNGFPPLEFSTHIFADDPSMRAVVVNDKRLVEGEQMGELVLRAVTEEGVVFGYRNHRVAVSVVELWAD